MKKFKIMTPKEWEQIKALTNTSLKNKVIQEVSGRSSATVSTIKRSESFQDYKRIVREYLEKRDRKRKEKKKAQAEKHRLEENKKLAKEYVELPKQEKTVNNAVLANAIESNVQRMIELKEAITSLTLAVEDLTQEIKDASEGRSGFLNKMF